MLYTKEEIIKEISSSVRFDIYRYDTGFIIENANMKDIDDLPYNKDGKVEATIKFAKLAQLGFVKNHVEQSVALIDIE